MKVQDMINKSDSTNITPSVQEAFEAIASGNYDNFALFSCFLDGKPTAAIVSVTENGLGGVSFSPLFVAVTDDIGPRLTDHEGVAPVQVSADGNEDWDALLDDIFNS